jgi:hypothetical protein
MKELFTALSKAQGQIRGAVKENVNPHFKSRYADLESVIDAIRKPLADNGLGFVQSISDGYCSTVIVHTSGEQFVSTVPFLVAGNDMQKIGSALTYARRQGICAAFGVPQVDDDAQSCSQPAPAPVAKKAAPAPVAKPVAQPPAEVKVAPGLLTDGYLEDEPDNKPSGGKFQYLGESKARTVAEDAERLGLTVEVRDVWPLFVEGRDNDQVKSILAALKIPAESQKKHRAALKSFLSETIAFTDLRSATEHYFLENR